MHVKATNMGRFRELAEDWRYDRPQIGWTKGHTLEADLRRGAGGCCTGAYGDENSFFGPLKGGVDVDTLEPSSLAVGWKSKQGQEDSLPGRGVCRESSTRSMPSRGSRSDQTLPFSLSAGLVCGHAQRVPRCTTTATTQLLAL